MGDALVIEAAAVGDELEFDDGLAELDGGAADLAEEGPLLEEVPWLANNSAPPTVATATRTAMTATTNTVRPVPRARFERC